MITHIMTLLTKGPTISRTFMVTCDFLVDQLVLSHNLSFRSLCSSSALMSTEVAWLQCAFRLMSKLMWLLRVIRQRLRLVGSLHTR